MLIYKGTNIRHKWDGKIRVRGVRRPILPSRKVSLTTRRGMVGARAGRVTREALYLEVDIRVLGNLATRRQVAREMAAWLDDDIAQTISFTDEPSLIYYGLLDDGIDFDEALRVSGDLTLVFVCPNPYAVGKAVSTTISGAGSTIKNDGTADTFPKFRVTLNVSQSAFTITNQTAEKNIKVIRNFLVGDVIEIDCDTRTVKINDVDARAAVDFTSRFFALEGGKSNTIGHSGSATVVMDYYERWK